MRTWRSAAGAGIVIEGIQTGDGRVWADGSFTWAPLPLPLAWMVDGTQHVDLSEMAPQIGTIEEINRGDGGLIVASGLIDDDNPIGAELARRMDAGLASHGAREFVSVDPDNWALEIIATDGMEEDLLASARPLLALSGRGRFPTRADVHRILAGMTAAAGDPDPGPGGGDTGVLLFEDSVDSILLRFTQSRIRGVTAVATPAFDGAFIELDPAGSDSTTADSRLLPAGRTAEVLAAHAGPALRSPVVLVPDRLPFEVVAPPAQVDGSLNVDEYRVSGYVALWDSCHNGYADQCVPPPREDASYGAFRHGQGRQLEDGTFVQTGVLTWGIPHADLDLDQLAAFQHYADARHGFADVVVGADEHGIWHAGSLRGPSAISDGITHDDVRVLRCLSLSGDWRWDQRSRGLRMIASLAVNHPGFQVPRLVASSGSMASDAARRAGHIIGLPDSRLSDDGDHLVSLVAAGIVQPAAYPVTASSCSCQSSNPEAEFRAEVRTMLRTLDSRTRHLARVAADDALARIRASH